MMTPLHLAFNKSIGIVCNPIGLNVTHLRRFERIHYHRLVNLGGLFCDSLGTYLGAILAHLGIATSFLAELRGIILTI